MKYQLRFISIVLVALKILILGCNGIILLDKMMVKNLFTSGVLDLNFFRCFGRNSNYCPNPDIEFRLFTPKGPRHGVPLHVKNPWSLYSGGFDKNRETTIIVHGFNGTSRDTHLMYLRDAYNYRDYNVISVDWSRLTQYPCYLSALLNTRLTAQCMAQIYAFLLHHGQRRHQITCVGHSLGAHVCGVMTNYLTHKQHRIIGVDPARPLIERKKPHVFRLSRDDAYVVQVIHTNAGFLGQEENIGHLNYCVNGGKNQPYCKGHAIRRARCSHFLSICFLANAIFKQKKFLGVPCPRGCTDLSGPGRLPVSSIDPFGVINKIQHFQMGNDAPDEAYGVFCIDVPFAKHCPFNDIR